MGRLASIDALRGVTVAAMLLVNTPGDWGHVYAPLLHAAWDGCTPTDLVFPFFLFVAGVSMAFSLVPRALAAPLQRPALLRAVMARALRILIAGALLHLLAYGVLDLPHYRLWGVLQRIAVCVAVVGALAVLAGARVQAIIVALLLVGYGAWLGMADSLAPWVNPVSRLDTAWFAPWLYQWQPGSGLGHDPEGLPSTAGAIATTGLGLLAGQLLRARNARWLVAGGTLLLLVGVAVSAVLPLNKQLWTPSYVLYSGGLAALALWLAHRLVDHHGIAPLGRRFGVNAITVYVGASAMSIVLGATGAWAWIWSRWAGLLPDDLELASLLQASAFVAVWWCVAAYMDRRGIYLRI